MDLKIISGGQTGADRGALDAALDAGVPCGGFCPKGRKTEDGPIPEKYPLEEMSNASYLPRTKKNIQTSDGTLVVVSEWPCPTRGTQLTINTARAMKKPVLVVTRKRDCTPLKTVQQVLDWHRKYNIKVLNVAGQRESSDGTIYQKTYDLITAFIEELRKCDA